MLLRNRQRLFPASPIHYSLAPPLPLALAPPLPLALAPPLSLALAPPLLLALAPPLSLALAPPLSIFSLVRPLALFTPVHLPSRGASGSWESTSACFRVTVIPLGQRGGKLRRTTPAIS